MPRTYHIVNLALAGVLLLLSLAGAMVAQQASAQPTPAERAAQAVPAANGSYALFWDKQQRVTSASVQVDSAGNRHAAYVVAAPLLEDPPAVYRFCPAGANCADPAQWQSVNIQDEDKLISAIEVQLQLTPQNQPRLLIRSAWGPAGTMHYYFAECDAGCTTRSNWKLGYAFNTDGTAVVDVADMDQPQRNFALDPQGRPRVMYYDRNYGREPDHWGGFYIWCDSDCTERESWQEAWLLRGAIFEYPSITFAKDGRVRMVSQIYGSNSEGVYYLECEAECDDLNDFYIVPIATRGAETLPSWDIELDAQDRPRIVFYRGSDINRSEGERLYYLECNADCRKPEGWQRIDLGVEQGYGQDPDLVIDAQGRMRIAWTSQLGSLGFSYCNASCLQPAAWTNLHFQEETDVKWRQEFPQALPPNCTDSVWKAKNTVLAVDGADTLNIAFDIEINARCVEETPGDPTPYLRYRRIWDTVRHIAYPLNGGATAPGGKPSVYLPAVQR